MFLLQYYENLSYQIKAFKNIYTYYCYLNNSYMSVITCQLLDMLNMQIKNYHCVCKKVIGKYFSTNRDVV